MVFLWKPEWTAMQKPAEYKGMSFTALDMFFYFKYKNTHLVTAWITKTQILI